jgi:hypothetical protein
VIRDTFHNDLISQRRDRFRKPWEAQVRYMTELMKEALSFAGAILYPVSNNGTTYTGTVDMSKCNRVQFICMMVTAGGGGNASFQLQQTNYSNGASNTNVATTNTGTGTSILLTGSSQVGTIECRADQLTARYCQVSQTIGFNASTAGCIPEATEYRQHPQNTDVSSVVSRVYA